MASNLQPTIDMLTAAGADYEIMQTEIWGRPCRSFKNAPDNLRELYRASRSAQEFIIYNEERYSFEDIWQRACTLAHILVNDYDIQTGDRIAISMRNYPEWMIAFMAATSIGAITCALNSLWQPSELQHTLADCSPRIFIGDKDRIAHLQACDELPVDMQAIAVRMAKVPDGIADWQQLMDRPFAQDMPVRDIAPTDPATMLFTSGSTGYPKGVVSCHRNILNALFSWELDITAAAMNGIFDIPPDDAPQAATLLSIPLFHVTGLLAVFMMSFRAQRRCITTYKWDVEEAAKIIMQEGVTQFVAPPAITGDLVKFVQANPHYNLNSLAVVGGGGAPRAPEQVRNIDAVFENTKPNTGWGMTETNAIGAGIAGSDYLERPASSGRCSAVLDIRIVDETGAELPPHQRGELQIRGGSVFEGYWNRPEANAESFDGDWFRTGDVAYLDEDSFLFIVDRIKDLVIRGGENIGCGAVEAAIQEHDDIIEACVYGVPDERLGEEVGATIYATTDISEEELCAFLASRLGRFEIPRYFEFTTKPLPRIASGKINKRGIRDEVIKRFAAS